MRSVASTILFYLLIIATPLPRTGISRRGNVNAEMGASIPRRPTLAAWSLAIGVPEEETRRFTSQVVLHIQVGISLVLLVAPARKNCLG